VQGTLNNGNLKYFVVAIVAFGVVCFLFGDYVGHKRATPEERIDTVRVVDYKPVPDTAFVAEVLDSLDADHRREQERWLSEIERTALERENLTTVKDSLRAVNNQLKAELFLLTQLKVIPLAIEGCGLVTVTYNPLTNQAEVEVTSRPPLKLETVYITITKVVKERDYTFTAIVSAIITILTIWLK
jgi:hypothetical protein